MSKQTLHEYACNCYIHILMASGIQVEVKNSTEGSVPAGWIVDKDGEVIERNALAWEEMTVFAYVLFVFSGCVFIFFR